MQTITVKAPSSKSVSHRALICAALASGKSEIHQILHSVDISVTRKVLQQVGASIEEDGEILRITGMENGPLGTDTANADALPLEIFMAESGTSCRLLTAVLAAGKGLFRISGEPRLHERPMAHLSTPLTQAGAHFHFEKKQGFPPFILQAKGLSGGNLEISLDASSQYLSGLLLAAPLAKQSTTLSLVGKKTVSWPYIALTLKAMEDFKIHFTTQLLQENQWTTVPWRSLKQIKPGTVRFIVQPSSYEASNYLVEADWSGGSYLLAAGAVGQNPVKVEGLRPNSLQGDRAILPIMQSMGAQIEADHHSVTAFPSTLHGITVDMRDCPDLVPTVAVLAAFADSPTTINNVEHLRIKECDRLC